MPIINPTLKIANFGPNNLVRPKETIANKMIAVDINNTLFSINFDLHNRSYTNQKIINDKSEIIMA